MDFGDIIYFLILVIFMILGFFNDSRKKKRQKQAEAESRPILEEMQEEVPSLPKIVTRKTFPPPVPAPFLSDDVHKEFRSSIDLVSIHGGQSPQSSYNFDYDANSFYEKDHDSPDAQDNAKEEFLKGLVHPLIKGLGGETGHEELKKAVIYSEVIRRRY